jgi:hypothetical protein
MLAKAEILHIKHMQRHFWRSCFAARATVIVLRVGLIKSNNAHAHNDYSESHSLILANVETSA